ncbi:hypothetical protein [Botrimarina mediterranea]|uniref:Uncharacterized protein n=1 Tax=Botrimarina mediterranea TaxID=2528022 RepID=A0A518K7A5_9BACT|nr:hypothetical protein [Botrimarina mediterranea]QDV73674.1 hypothetical protein Spa11_18730 [Botrimarina mediterranea]QDV78264.1 hypothetical protein K2D_18710 [Planctomycetes bacterium K2D]
MSGKTINAKKTYRIFTEYEVTAIHDVYATTIAEAIGVRDLRGLLDADELVTNLCGAEVTVVVGTETTDRGEGTT